MIESATNLIASAATAEIQGRWSEAVASYDHAYRVAIAARDFPLITEVVIRLGHCLRQAGQPEVAADTLGLGVELAELNDDAGQAARALNGLAILQQQAGNIEAAESIYLRARDLLLAVGNRERLGEIEQNLGTLDNIRGDLESARRYYLAGLEHLESARAERSSTYALNNLGMVHVDLRRFDEAEQYFERALKLAQRIGDVVAECVIHLNRAELFLERGLPLEARMSCDEGFEIASRLGDQSRRGEALKFYGIIYRHLQKLHLALIHLNEAIEVAAGREPLLEAEAQRELALVLRGLERNREALAALNRSHALFTGLQARSDEADVGRRITQLEEDFLSLVRFWGESIEAKDRYTRGHCERVAEYACRLAERVGLSPREIVWFRMGAFLHDLGKTEVPAEVLNKPARLTDEERAIMELHTVTGYEMLGSVEFPWDIRPMVRSHHERWDGKGYPDRLAGEEIHLSARILRIADIYDALTTARSYRHPLTPEEAFELMENDEGSFDPELFEVFRELFPSLREFTLSWVEAESDAAPPEAEPPRPVAATQP